MIPGIDPKKIQSMMKQMGINQSEIEASKVTIETPDKKIIINNPNVQKINMQGQTNFQISGDISEEPLEDPEENKEEDIKTIMEKTNCSKEEAEKALEEHGDLTEALLSLS